MKLLNRSKCDFIVFNVCEVTKHVFCLQSILFLFYRGKNIYNWLTKIILEQNAQVRTFGLNFYFIFITDIITKQYNNSEIHVQTLYKWDSEGSQMTYLNLYPKTNFYNYVVTYQYQACDLWYSVFRIARTLWADGVEISVIYHLNNQYYSILYLYHPN